MIEVNAGKLFPIWDKPWFNKTCFSTFTFVVAMYGAFIVDKVLKAELPRPAPVQGVTVSAYQEKSVDHYYRILLENFVYKNSKMPMPVCKQIVTAVMQTERPELLLAVFKKESHYDPHQIGPKTRYGYAYGLGQVIWSIHHQSLRAIGIQSSRELFIIEKAVMASSFVLTTYLEREAGNIKKALGRYYGKNDPKYVDPIISTYLHLLELKIQAKEVSDINNSRLNRR